MLTVVTAIFTPIAGAAAAGSVTCRFTACQEGMVAALTTWRTGRFHGPSIGAPSRGVVERAGESSGGSGRGGPDGAVASGEDGVVDALEVTDGEQIRVGGGERL